MFSEMSIFYHFIKSIVFLYTVISLAISLTSPSKSLRRLSRSAICLSCCLTKPRSSRISLSTCAASKSCNYTIKDKHEPCHKKTCFLHMLKHQHLCFHYIDSTIPQLPEFKISSLYPSSVAVQPGLCRTWSETPKTGFVVTG